MTKPLVQEKNKSEKKLGLEFQLLQLILALQPRLKVFKTFLLDKLRTVSKSLDM